MIVLNDVHRTFIDGSQRLEILKGVDWTVQEGESVAVTGRSGCGKTTLLNLIGGLDRQYSGQISVDGVQLDKLSDRQLAQFRNQNIGLVFQSFHLMDQLTSEENVLLPTWFSHKTDASYRTACELLERLGLGNKIGQYPQKLSGGEKQRIAIARSLIMKPKIMLCDEPTGNLDEDTGEEILQLFQQLHREENITIIFVTHEQRTADAAQSVVRLQHGQIVSEQKA